VRLAFTLYLPLNAGDTLQLKLGGFGGSDVGSLAVDANIDVATRWIEKSLIFPLTSPVAGGFPVDILVPLSTGISIPVAGVLPNSPTLSLTVVSADGPIQNYPITNNGIGSFSFSEIQFSPAVAGAPNEIAVTFTSRSSILPGETVAVTLPGFSAGSLTEQIVLSDPPGVVYSCAWDAATSQLMFFVASTIAVHP